MSKCGGSCGGPYWPIRQSATKNTRKFELEAKRIAFKLRADFSIVNQLPPHSPWWKKNKVYLKWMEMKGNHKKRKYGIEHRPALVVSLNDKYKAFYDWDELENKINRFVITAM